MSKHYEKPGLNFSNFSLFLGLTTFQLTTPRNITRSDGILKKKKFSGRAKSPSLEVFKNCGDVALRYMVSGHGGGGSGLDWMILEVFSNLYDSIINE